MSTRSLYKVGTTVRCTRTTGYNGIHIGQFFVIGKIDVGAIRLPYRLDAISSSGKPTGRQFWVQANFHERGHEFVVVHEPLEVPKLLDTILTPTEIVQCVQDGVTLEVRGDEADEWRVVLVPDSITIRGCCTNQFRKYVPKTICVNGQDVPAPLPLVKERQIVYGINLTRGTVFETVHDTANGHFWGTREEAKQVLNAVKLSFKDTK